MDVSKTGGSSTEDIQAKLDKKLGPEYISKRVGFGANRVAYIEGWKAINLANQIFGYNGWSTEVKSITIDFMDERQGKFCIGCTAIIRVTLSDGTFREDIGYGTVENERRKSSAFERAKKSAVTDALKRSLRAFGNALGNCLYDKSFLAKIDKVKFDPPDFDEGNLYRATDEFTENSRTGDSSRGAPTGLPTGAPRNDHDAPGPPHKRRNIKQIPSAASPPAPAHEIQPQRAQQPQPSSDQDPDELLDDSFMFSDELQDDDILAAGEAQPTTPALDRPANSHPNLPPQVQTPVAFVTAKAAPNLQNKAPVPPGSMFDPQFRAQSIRHTVDQTTSSHVKTSVLRERGLPNNRSAIYNQYAPKGKLLGDTNTIQDSPILPRERPPISSVAASTTTITNITPHEAPAKEVHNNGHANPVQLNGNSVHAGNVVPSTVSSPTTTVRSVGKPKMHHPNARNPI
ncbi:LAQU0S11e04214g1_1 [Lachancea quebecensis]|uniref:DNA repair and recombination protein RAD52 n=1 Tax=Lachancea quebecensis TaxID=1654605 RepID=A0A0P1KUG6_9SACH|nr:LAQU0S11e04214g1_1 [Lachancea quebecensis]